MFFQYQINSLDHTEKGEDFFEADYSIVLDELIFG